MGQDPVIQQQKEAKLAKLSIRRLMRERLTRGPDENSAQLARSNAVIIKRAAQSLIRGREDDVETGWEGHGRIAALLCFDEMQVNDPFAAVALKGRAPSNH